MTLELHGCIAGAVNEPPPAVREEAYVSLLVQRYFQPRFTPPTPWRLSSKLSIVRR